MSLVRLVGYLLLHAGELLLEVEDLVLVQFCQVVELLLQTFAPEHVRADSIISLNEEPDAEMGRNRPDPDSSGTCPNQ